MQAIIECVPNFSEGRDLQLIRQITDAIESVEGVRLLNVDPGKATNRTVVTFVGTPPSVVEAAFQAIRKAGLLIDMKKHRGEHPRMGATDVCPLVPIAGISLEEVALLARQLGERVGRELDLPVYLYEAAQSDSSRSNLSAIRAGEYEGFFEKIKLPAWKPDFGPAEMDPKRGATVIGARDFLVAYNVNLNTKSVRKANAVAFDLREAGRVKREGHPVTGKIMTDEKGNPVTEPGSLRFVKAIGWYIEEYGIAQISMNLTNIGVTPVHIAFDEACRKAEDRGLRVTGSELVGLIPLKSILDAGKYFLQKQKRSAGVCEKELVKMAIQSLGLEDQSPFKPEERIIEYLLQNKEDHQLASMTLSDFADETASESTAPGGGSVSAYLGVLAASLGTMVANLSAGKKGWEERWEDFSKWAEKGESFKSTLIRLVDADTKAFHDLMAAYGLQKNSPDEKVSRAKAIQEAILVAIKVPFQVMQAAGDSMELIQSMVESGNPNSISDAGVAALCARSAVMGAFLNVRINASGLDDQILAQEMIRKGKEIEDRVIARENEILRMVNDKI
jgi:glutamate formiminotransferase / formiminotetrahydrofolate cyclodeaminase